MVLVVEYMFLSLFRCHKVTNSLAKIAEKFVSRHLNEYFDEFTDDNQFGSYSLNYTCSLENYA